MTHFRRFRTLTARTLGGFLADPSGATAIEYGVMTGLIAVAIMSIVFSMGQGIKNTLFGHIVNSLAAMM
jgi:pilus assembly protein Flp/PilA